MHGRALNTLGWLHTHGVAARVLAVLMTVPTGALMSAQTATAVALAESLTPDTAAGPDAPSESARAPSPDAVGLADCEAQVRTLKAALADREAHLAELQRRVGELNELRQQLDALRARLPAREGGSVTADEARRQAGADAAALRELVQKAHGIDNPRLWSELRGAENSLHRSQYLLARAEGARTVYRVRPGDDLPRIGVMFYGDPERWTQLYDANRHVIDDPNGPLAGTTLIVP